MDLRPRHPDSPDFCPTESIGLHLEQILVELDQVRPPSNSESTKGGAPPRHNIRLLEVGPERLRQSQALLGMKRVPGTLSVLAPQHRRLEPEERAGAIEGSVRAEEQSGAGPEKRSIGVGASGARAPLPLGDDAIRDLVDGLNRCVDAKRLEPGKIFFPCELDVLDPWRERKGAPALNRAFDCIERVSDGSVADRVNRDGEPGLPCTRASIRELRPRDDLDPGARTVLILAFEERGSRPERSVREKLHRTQAQPLVPPSTTQLQRLRGVELRRRNGEEKPERERSPCGEPLGGASDLGGIEVVGARDPE